MAEAVEDREHQEKIRALRAQEHELKLENEKLLPIRLIEKGLIKNRATRTASGFDLKKS